MALSANREVDRYVDQEIRSYPAGPGSHVYKGGFVGLNSGYARALHSGDRCVGIAYEEADNTAGSAGDVEVRVFTLGDFRHALPGAVATNVGDAVYASDDDTLTFESTDNSYVGVCVNVLEAGTIVLRLNPYTAAVS